MYRHPYPVGYRASIVKWGSIWIMEIQEGPNGPRFVVRQKRDDETEDGTPIIQKEADDDVEEAAAAQEVEQAEEKENYSGAGCHERHPDKEKGTREGGGDQKTEKKKRTTSFKRFEGPSATQPWTKACINGPSPGSRVSGPLLFGFSDPLTIHILNRLEKNAVGY